MSSGWSPERRAKQAQAIRTWQPWARSTGPKTDCGKAKTARNADKGKGELTRLLQQVRQHLRDNDRAIRELEPVR